VFDVRASVRSYVRNQDVEGIVEETHCWKNLMGWDPIWECARATLCKMVQNVANWCKMVQNDVKWSKIVQNDAKWCKMVQNSTKWCNMVQNSVK
jgi:hypothetical protein